MTTSGTTTFNLDMAEVIEEAYEQAGLEVRTGYDFRTARRSLNLLSIDWANRGIPMWAIDQQSIPLVSGTAAYNLPADTLDILEAVVQQSGQDISIRRIAMPTYATIPNKTQQGRPVQFYVQRLAAPTVTLWPVPNLATYTLIYWRMRRIQDAGTSGDKTFDIPYRFLPCLTAGLAYFIAQKKPEAEARIPRLKQNYEELWANAAGEDRERATWRVIPDVKPY